MKKVMIIGDICKQLVYYNCLKHVKIVKRVYFPSPISLGEQCTNDFSCENLGKGSCLDIKKNFGTLLKDYPCDFLILDLSKLCTNLFKKENIFYTVPSKADELHPFYVGFEDTKINPLDFSPADFFGQFDNFINIILDVFKGQQVILIHANWPKYFVIKDYVRDLEGSQYQKWIDIFEKRFIQRTSCNYIDVTRFYFANKTGKKVNPFVYEEYAYKNIRIVIDSIVNGNTLLDREQLCDFYSYKRYIAFYENLDKKFLKIFLDQKDIVDEFVSCCPKEFIANNIDILVLLKKQNVKKLAELVAFFDTIHSESELVQLLWAYNCVKEQNYYDVTVSYDLIFKNQLQIPQLLEKIQDYIKEYESDIVSKQVNYANYGYWFYRMHYILSNDETLKQRALEYMDIYKHSTVNLAPTLVDVWGSCISRVPINFNDKQLAVNKYLFQVMPLGINNEPVQYDEEIFLKGKRNLWRDKLAKIELNHAAKSMLDESESKWIVLDLFTLSAANIYMYKQQYFNFQPKVGKDMKAELVDFYNDESMFSYVKNELFQLGNYLKQRYGDNIILVKNKRQEFYVSANNEVTRYSNLKANKVKNEFTNWCNEELVNYLDCYYIDLVDQFLGSELSLFQLTPTHFENELYVEEGRIIQEIVEGRASTKRYTTYSNNIRIQRFEKLLRGEYNTVIGSLFTDKVLDKYVLQMDSMQIRSWHNLLVDLYDNEFITYEQAFDYMEKNSKYEPILNFIKKLEN